MSPLQAFLSSGLALSWFLLTAGCITMPDQKYQQSQSLRLSGEQALEQNRAEEAAASLREALAIREGYFGTEDDIGAALNNGLGMALAAQQQYGAAEDHFRKALRVFQTFRCYNDYRAGIVFNLCEVLAKQGRTEEAEALAVAELEASRAPLGPDDPAVALGSLSCGLAFARQGKFAEAEVYFKSAATIFNQAARADAVDAALSLHYLGVAMLLNDDSRNAQVPLTRAVDIRSTRLGASHPETIASRKALTQASEATQPAPASTVPTAEKPRKSKKDEFEELIEPGRDWEWRWRNFLNFVDDYYDDAKHEVHGRKIGESRFFLPRWLMLGSGNPCK